MKRFVLLVFLSACSSKAAPITTDADVCTDLADDASSRPANEKGDLGQINFSFWWYDDLAQESGATDFDLVAFGSSTQIILQAREQLAQAVTLTSSDPSVGELRAQDGSATPVVIQPGCHTFASPTLLTHGAGTFQLIATGADGTIVDTKTYTSLLPTSLGVASTTPKLVLAGSSQEVHAVTYDKQGDILRGSGAVQFQLTGALQQTSSTSGPSSTSEGDEVGFTASAPGNGSVIASVGTLSEEMPITVIDGSAIDGLDVEVGVEDSLLGTALNVARVSASSGGVPVYGVECTWKYTPVYDITVNELHPDTIAYGEAEYTFIGNDTPLTATCTIAGGLSRTVTIPADQ